MLDGFQSTSSVLLGTTATLAVVHTVLGIDHSLPFVVLGRTRSWSLNRTLLITLICGLGHVASSVFIGAVGVALGIALDSLLWLESIRGELAASLFIGFGLAYAAWAVWTRLRGLEHTHLHAHADGTTHCHRHAHHGEHLHPHGNTRNLTPWALFVLFLLGPCEPLIPLMMVPAMAHDWPLVVGVVVIFGLLTVAVMLATVTVVYLGIGVAGFGRLDRYADLLVGLVIAASGAAVLLLGI